MQRVGNLIIHVEENGATVILPPNSSRYGCVEAIVHMALCVLETPQGRQSLTKLGNELVAQRNAQSRPGRHLFRGQPASMHLTVDEFLRKIRSDFPEIVLKLFIGEAAAIKKTWGDNLQSYEPKAAADMWLHMSIIENMLFARQQPRQTAGNSYALFKFQMVVSVAHEICHFFTGFLTGTQRPFTPPDLAVEGFGNPTYGESGRWWEVQMFGGLLEFYENRNDPLGRRQAGIPYMLDDGTKSSPARQLSVNYVLDFIDGNFSFPARPASNMRPTTKGALQTASREVTELRPRRRNLVPPPSSPPRANTPSGSSSRPPSWRRLPFLSSR